MEDANMSQNAEQAATGSVMPGGKPDLKRQYSADSFRALTMRLNGQKASSCNSAPNGSLHHEPVEKLVVESATDHAPSPDNVFEHSTAPEAGPEQQPDFPENGALTPEPEAAEIESPATATIESLPEPAIEEVAPEFAMPASGTKIILNPAPKQESTTATTMLEEDLFGSPEAVLPEDMSDETIGQQPIEPVTQPVAEVINPLQAALDLLNNSDLSGNNEEPGSQIEAVSAAEGVQINDATAEAPLVETETPVVDPPVEEPLDLTVIPEATEDLQVQQQEAGQQPAQSPPIIGENDEQALELEPDVQSGETAKALLDIMSSGSQPQERALAADTLLRLVPRMMVKDLVALSERVCMMEDAPPLLVKALINHREPRVASPLLEDGKVVVEQDLLRLITTTDVDRLIMMAKHRSVTQTVCDALIARGEPSVYLTLVRNPGAALSHDAFVAFNEIAKSQSSLQAPLATRGDTPPPIAFELFWSLPVELRRYVLSRFLTDSATLDKILKITQSVEGGASSEQKFPSKRRVEELVDLIADGITNQAAQMMAELAGINEENARRIIADPDGEPLTVALKTMGQSRAQFSQAIKKCASSSKAMLRSDRDLAELQIIFDSLSFNKARTLVTYWDWAIEKSGPYTRRVM